MANPDHLVAEEEDAEEEEDPEEEEEEEEDPEAASVSAKRHKGKNSKPKTEPKTELKTELKGKPIFNGTPSRSMCKPVLLCAVQLCVLKDEEGKPIKTSYVHLNPQIDESRRLMGIPTTGEW